MADDPSLNLPTFDRVCVDGVCHCDWRINLQDCEESVAMWYVNVINIAISALVSAIGVALLFHRVVLKGHTFWNHQIGTRGFLRPKPVDCMLVFFVVFNLLRLVTSVVLVTDAAPGNWIIRSFLYEVPWSSGLGGITIYLIGIAQTISQSKSVSGWLPSPVVIDILGTITLVGPVLTGIPISFGAGAAAMKNDVATATALIKFEYISWSAWVFFVGGSVFYAALRLVRILRAHHQKHRRASNYGNVVSGIRKIQLQAATFTICLLCFGFLLFLYPILRDQIMVNKAGSIFAGSAWAFLGGVACLVAELTVVLSPRIQKNAALRSNKSSNGESISSSGETTTVPDLERGGSTIGAITTTFQNDNDAIFNAIKLSEANKCSREKRSLSNFFPSKSSRHLSDASSQIELTAHDY